MKYLVILASLAFCTITVQANDSVDLQQDYLESVNSEVSNKNPEFNQAKSTPGIELKNQNQKVKDMLLKLKQLSIF